MSICEACAAVTKTSFDLSRFDTKPVEYETNQGGGSPRREAGTRASCTSPAAAASVDAWAFAAACEKRRATNERAVFEVLIWVSFFRHSPQKIYDYVAFLLNFLQTPTKRGFRKKANPFCGCEGINIKGHIVVGSPLSGVCMCVCVCVCVCALEG